MERDRTCLTLAKTPTAPQSRLTGSTQPSMNQRAEVSHCWPVLNSAMMVRYPKPGTQAAVMGIVNAVMMQAARAPASVDLHAQRNARRWINNPDVGYHQSPPTRYVRPRNRTGTSAPII